MNKKVDMNFLEILGTNALATGFIGGLLVWLGKGRLQKMQSDLNELRDQKNAHLDKTKFVFQAQFEKEFETYVLLSEKIENVCTFLEVSVLSGNSNDCMDKWIECDNVLQYRKPFINENIYNEGKRFLAYVNSFFDPAVQINKTGNIKNKRIYEPQLEASIEYIKEVEYLENKINIENDYLKVLEIEQRIKELKNKIVIKNQNGSYKIWQERRVNMTEKERIKEFDRMNNIMRLIKDNLMDTIRDRIQSLQVIK